MVSLLLVPLTSAVLRLREHVIDSWGASLEDASTAGNADSEHRRLWRWSDVTVVAATPIRNGVEVMVRGGRRDRDREIGWWVNGWPAGRSAVDATGRALASTGEVANSSDTVLTIRAREQGGGWGVPWRVVLGSATAEVRPGSLGGASSPSSGGPGEGGAVAVVHMRIPGQGLLDPGDSNLPGLLAPTGDALTLFMPSGVASLSCDGELQSLLVEPGSVTHVFF